MDSNKQLLEQITNAVIKHLNLDENLFFCSFRETRILEARKYACYMAMKLGIPSIKVAKYYGYDQSRSVQQKHSEIVRHILNYGNSQCGRDIEAIEKILDA